MKRDNPRSIAAHLEQKYGAEGSIGRNAFRQKAQAYIIAEVVKSARKRANLTQEQLAEKVHLKRPHISRIERAKTDVRISTLHKIAIGLGGSLKISIDL